MFCDPAQQTPTQVISWLFFKKNSDHCNQTLTDMGTISLHLVFNMFSFLSVKVLVNHTRSVISVVTDMALTRQLISVGKNICLSEWFQDCEVLGGQGIMPPVVELSLELCGSPTLVGQSFCSSSKSHLRPHPPCKDWLPAPESEVHRPQQQQTLAKGLRRRISSGSLTLSLVKVIEWQRFRRTDIAYLRPSNSKTEALLKKSNAH